MSKGIIYYTDNKLIEPIFTVCQKYILDANLPIVSCSLKPIKFGRNIVLKGKPGYPTMVNQIVTALETSEADCVFFCEHDVLYHPTHFDFSPPQNDIYYYNMNNWRWDYPTERIISYEGLTSLSQLCVNRKLALKHFKMRQKRIQDSPEEFTMKDPRRARIWGYEPGRKKRSNGALIEENSRSWTSEFPNIDIRHSGTFSLPKVKLKDFFHKPSGWNEGTIDKIAGWNLRELLPE